mmetsp:Transcript_106018/g.295936  ORF Transcript_106018/g.295936 Transcript_106018/m.295936 type:complete len:233 (-) Transcript_106018:604-1302(-)
MLEHCPPRLMEKISIGGSGCPGPWCSTMARQQDCWSCCMTVMATGLFAREWTSFGGRGISSRVPWDHTHVTPSSSSVSLFSTAIHKPSSEVAMCPPRLRSLDSCTSCERAAFSRQQNTSWLENLHTRTCGPLQRDSVTQGGSAPGRGLSAKGVLSLSGSSSVSWPLGHTMLTFCIASPFGESCSISRQTAMVPSTGFTATCRTSERQDVCLSFFRNTTLCDFRLYRYSAESV